MSAPSAKPLFQATKPKPKIDPRQVVMSDMPEAEAPVLAAPVGRDPLDFDPTPPDATAAFLAAEIDHIRAHGQGFWETAVGAGHIAKVLDAHGFEVLGNDVVDRGWPDVQLGSFYESKVTRAPVQITNPPYNEINSRDGHGRWLRHSMDLQMAYTALLLNADWAAARQNGFDDLFAKYPPTVEYLCCWKIDFRGDGSPPQRNSWFVWDANRPPRDDGAWLRKRLYRNGNALQSALELEAAT